MPNPRSVAQIIFSISRVHHAIAIYFLSASAHLTSTWIFANTYVIRRCVLDNLDARGNPAKQNGAEWRKWNKNSSLPTRVTICIWWLSWRARVTKSSGHDAMGIAWLLNSRRLPSCWRMSPDSWLVLQFLPGSLVLRCWNLKGRWTEANKSEKSE